MTDDQRPPQWRGLRPHKLFARLAEEPSLGQAFDALGRTTVSSVDGRTLELIALRVSARRRCLYVWAAHTVIASNHPTHPLTLADIARVAADPGALDRADATVVRAVDELLAGGLSRSAQAALGSKALQVTVATFFYAAVAALMQGVEPEPDVAPPAGLETPPGR